MVISKDGAVCPEQTLSRSSANQSSLVPTLLLFFWLSNYLLQHGQAQSPTTFSIKLSQQATNQAITGRLFLFTTTNQQKPPMRGPNWFAPEPFAAIDVQELQPGKIVTIDDRADCYPGPISTWKAGSYRIQAVLDHDFYYPEAANGPGNFFSQVVVWNTATERKVDLVLDQLIPGIVYSDSERVKIVQLSSQLLSKFYGKEVIDRAAIILPQSYSTDSQRRYPVFYEITGFGGNLRAIAASQPKPRNQEDQADNEFIHVILTGECKWGHHVYANSQTNGPRADALVGEMIPWIDNHYRTISGPEGRFVGGHSSGGWSSLWLQVNYPEHFGGVFSTSPDPVDFRDFQGINLYANPPESAYIAGSERRPLARRGQQVILWYDDFCKMDHTLGRGGQMRSFEAVFSPIDSAGKPKRCWDIHSGLIDSQVAQDWKKFDISLTLAENWQELSPKLAGKLHIAMGELDTFYLEGSTRLLSQRLKELGSDAQIEFIPGASHNLPSQVLKKMRQKMIDKF